MFTFHTSVIIPASAVNNIGQTIRKNFLELLLKDTPDEDIYAYSMLLNQAIGKCIGDYALKNDRWELDRGQAFTIANHLRNNKRIEAIKEFRSCTGVGLKEGLEFINSFGLGNAAADLFINTFI